MKAFKIIVLIACCLLLANANPAFSKRHLVGGTGSSHKGGHYVDDGVGSSGSSSSSTGSSSSSGSSSRSSSTSKSGSSSRSYDSSHSRNYSTTNHVKSLHYSQSTINSGVARDSHGRIKRSESAKDEFLREHGLSKVPPGYAVDHITPLYAGGSDTPGNMQLLSKAQHHAKTKSDYQRYGR
jgi:5-methylcytosine-specific restriction endonuclease McrA